MIDHVQYSASKITLHVSLTIYSLDAIKKTCYKFTDQCSIFLKEIKEEEVEVIFDLDEEWNESQKKHIIKSFCNELLDQDLREKIAAETKATRNLILAQAFSKTSLLDD